MERLFLQTISRWQDHSSHPSQTFPSLVATPTGRLIASWRCSPTKEGICDNHVLFSISDDGGRSWGTPFRPCLAPQLEGRKGIFRVGSLSTIGNRLLLTYCWVDTSRPERPFFREENSGLLDCKIFLSVSDDDGATWSEPRLLDTSPYHNQPTPTTGPMLTLPDGRVALQFELNLPYESTEVWRHLPVLKFSHDLGRTFDHVAIPAKAEDNRIFYWDQRPIVLRSGKIVDFFWTWDNVSSCYHNITMSESDDGGRSWSPVHDTGIPGQAGPGVELSDGRLAVPVVDRTAQPKIVLRLSEDQGRSFTDEVLELSGTVVDRQTAVQEDRNGAWREMTAFSLGLPAAVASGHGTVNVIWYAGLNTDQTDIEFAEARV
jgi:hypothetical protein